MEGEKALLSQRQLQTWHLMRMVEGEKITLKEAGNLTKCFVSGLRRRAESSKPVMLSPAMVPVTKRRAGERSRFSA